MGVGTPIWPIEGIALDSTGDEVAGSLGVVTKANASALTSIESKIDTIDTNVDDVEGYTQKIDNLATLGLAGTSNSLAYRVHEIEKHHHGREFWWGAVAVPDETNAIDANVNRPFVAVSGANAWGTAVPIMGTADIPANAGDVRYDAHKILVIDTDHATSYRMRFIWGAGTSVAAIGAGQ